MTAISTTESDLRSPVFAAKRFTALMLSTDGSRKVMTSAIVLRRSRDLLSRTSPIKAGTENAEVVPSKTPKNGLPDALNINALEMNAEESNTTLLRLSFSLLSSISLQKHPTQYFHRAKTLSKHLTGRTYELAASHVGASRANQTRSKTNNGHRENVAPVGNAFTSPPSTAVPKIDLDSCLLKAGLHGNNVPTTFPVVVDGRGTCAEPKTV